MPSHEKELDLLLNTSILKPPDDFLNKVMRQVENAPSAQFLRQGVVHQHIQAKNQLKIAALNLTKLAAFVFGIMLATAAV
ncbi:MAG: hypothetical protein RI918_454 [Pseudomonadota bacterium]|jgi:hypothetical protein